jgi:hypothetical protein
MTPEPRLLLGNLDAEEDLARLASPWDTPGQKPRRRQPFSAAALAQIAGAATLLRAFAREGDRLWTPVPVAANRLAPVPGLPIPVLEPGPLSRLAPAAKLLAWAETPHVAAKRLALGELVPGEAPLHELLWELRVSPPEVVARVHHRAFGLEVATRLGVSLSGARRISSTAELAAHLAAGAGATGWVVKAPLSAAGRARYVERTAGPALSVEARVRVEKLLERHGPLLFEPWMERTADFGAAVLLLPSGPRLVGFHRLLVDAVGRFRGIELRGEFAGIELPPEERETMERTVSGTAEALLRAGYVGSFGIDAWRYRRPDGSVAFHPLGEINARMTFGLVARALVDRVREPLGIDPAARVRLIFGSEIPAEENAVVPLLLSRPEGKGAAWLEWPRSPEPHPPDSTLDRDRRTEGFRQLRQTGQDLRRFFPAGEARSASAVDGEAEA